MSCHRLPTAPLASSQRAAGGRAASQGKSAMGFGLAVRTMWLRIYGKGLG